MSERKNQTEIEAIIQSITRSKKYRHRYVCEDTIRDLLNTELKHWKKQTDAVKAARKKLHHIVAPYLGDPDFSAAIMDLATAFHSHDLGEVKKVCARIMEAHTSTRERLSILDRFYARIFELTGPPTTILDLACGLNPLSFPWMGLTPSTRYYAYEINRSRAEFLSQYFLLQGMPESVRVQDVLVNHPEEEAEVAFIFKEVHRFERRKRGCSLALFDALKVRHLVVTLPTINLTGRWSLKDAHRQLFHNIIAQRPWRMREIEFENELVFCVEKLIPEG